MIEVVGEAQGFYVFLKTGGDLALVPPEAVAFELMLHAGIDILNLTELFSAACGCALGQGTIVSRFFHDDAVKEEDGLFGHVCDISTCLGSVK